MQSYIAIALFALSASALPSGLLGGLTDSLPLVGGGNTANSPQTTTPAPFPVVNTAPNTDASCKSGTPVCCNSAAGALELSCTLALLSQSCQNQICCTGSSEGDVFCKNEAGLDVDIPVLIDGINVNLLNGDLLSSDSKTKDSFNKDF